MIDRIREFFSPEQRRIIAAEAQQLLDNKHFREAFDAVESYLIASAKGCDPDNKEKAQRCVIALQILDGIKREIVRKVEDGEFAKIELQEIEKKNRRFRMVR